MAFKDRITAMFRRGDKRGKADTGSIGEPVEATATREIEAAGEVLHDRSSATITHVLERLDQHLEQGTQSLAAMNETQARLPDMLEKQQLLMTEVTQNAAASRQALDALKDYLVSRDEAQQQLLTHVAELTSGYKEQRDHERSQLDLVMTFYRSSRRVMTGLLLFTLIGVIALIMVILAIVMRPDLVGLQRGGAAPVSEASAVPPAAEPVPAAAEATPTASPDLSHSPASRQQAVSPRVALLREASESSDPQVAARAREALSAH